MCQLRGVDVRIMVPDNPDQMLVYLAAYSYFDEAGETGVQFYRYEAGFLHEKAMLIDDQVATIGTANFDNRSMRLNFEVSMLIVDKDFASEVEAMLEEDFANSRQAIAAEYTKAPLRFRMVVRLARLLAPVQ